MKLLLLFTYFLGSVSGLYEDQVGDSDWRQSFLGQSSWISFDHQSGGRRKVLLASEAGVLSAVNAASGKIAWRQELEANSLFAVTHYRSHLLTVSGSVSLTIRSWDTDSGLLKWEAPTSLPVPSDRRPLDSQWRPGGVFLEMSGAKKDQFVLVFEDVMAVYSTRSGKELWNVTLPIDQGVPVALIVEGVQLRLWLLGDGQLRCLEGDIGKGRAVPTETHTLEDPSLSQTTECVLVPSVDKGEWLPVCNVGSKIFTADFTSNELLPVQFKEEAKLSRPPGLRPGPRGHVHIGSDVYRLQDGNSLKPACVDCMMEEALSEKDESITLTVELDGQSLQIRNAESGEEVVVEDPVVRRGGLSRMKVIAFHKSDGSLTWRVALVREDASLSFLSQTGSLVWTREDALANIVAVEMVDLPSAQFDSEGFLSLLDSSTNPFMQAIKRWKLQASLFQDTIRDVIDRGIASLIQPVSTEELLRDKYNIRKLIVSVTAYNKVYAIDSSNGKVVWQLYLPSLRPLANKDHPYLLYTLRSSSHPPHAPLMVLVGRSEGCGTSAIYSFNPVSGELADENEECISHDIIQTLFLPFMDRTHKRVLVYLDAAGSIGCYPSGCGGVSFSRISTFMYTVDKSNGILRGYKIVGESEPAMEVWQIAIPPTEKILVVANKMSHDHAHSMGRVRANRDVQYKYLNPNAVAMVTKTVDATTKSSLTIYVIDSVTGGVVYRSTHRLTAGPVGILLCENWIMYHYFSIKSQRNELSVVEMYDPRNNTESLWSSLAPPTLPVVTTQSYIFSTSITTMTTTVTHRGITSRSLLLGLNSGRIFLLRKDLLDPRRNLTLTPQMTEEGVPIYVPDIPMLPQYYINYNQTISRIRGIRTTPTGLESTSLVFAYGLDLYVTRVQPSGQFDLLAEDFDYLLIAGVVLALVVATVVLSWLSRRKTLKRLWK